MLAAHYGATVLSPDDWMETLGIDLWDNSKRSAIELLQWQHAQEILRLDGVAIIEWGTWARDERTRLREAARALGAAVELHFLDAEPEELHRRTSARGRENPALTLEQLRDYWHALERPDADEVSLFDPPTEMRHARA